MNWFSQTIEVPCTVAIESSAESLHAHVDIRGDIDIQPGDQVLVHDAPTHVTFGEDLFVHRTATIVRAGVFERLWTRFTANFELLELYDVSFSTRRRL
jgi:hypothetical protein